MDELINLLEQDIDNLKSLVKLRGQIYRLTGASVKELEKKSIIIEKVIQALLVEVERIEYLSDWLYSQGKAARGFYRKGEAENLRAIIELMQEKT